MYRYRLRFTAPVVYRRAHTRKLNYFFWWGTAPKIAIVLLCYDRLYRLACLKLSKKEGEGQHSAVINTRMVTTGRGVLNRCRLRFTAPDYSL